MTDTLKTTDPEIHDADLVARYRKDDDLSEIRIYRDADGPNPLEDENWLTLYIKTTWGYEYGVLKTPEELAALYAETAGDPEKWKTRVVRGYAQSHMIFEVGNSDEPYTDQEGLLVLDRGQCKKRGISWRDAWNGVPKIIDDYQNWTNGWTLRYEEHRLLRCNLGHIHAIPQTAESGNFYGIPP